MCFNSRAKERSFSVYLIGWNRIEFPWQRAGPCPGGALVQWLGGTVIATLDAHYSHVSNTMHGGAYLRDITRQIAISRADLHRTCRDVASQMYVDVCVCVRVFSRRNILEMRRF